MRIHAKYYVVVRYGNSPGKRVYAVAESKADAERLKATAVRFGFRDAEVMSKKEHEEWLSKQRNS